MSKNISDSQADLLLMQESANKKISEKNQTLKKDVWTFILAAIVFTFLNYVAFFVTNILQETPASEIQSRILRSMIPTFVFLISTIILSIWLLRTKSYTVARNSIVFFGVCALYLIVRDIFALNIFRVVIDGFMLKRIYELYESI